MAKRSSKFTINESGIKAGDGAGSTVVLTFRNRECDAHWLTKKQVRLLKQLCHPDRHDNSQASAAAFEMLDKYPAREV